MAIFYSILLLLCVILAYTAASCVFWYDKYEEALKEIKRLKRIRRND